MRRPTGAVVLAWLLFALADDAAAARPNRSLAEVPLACEGDFDQAPVLVKGKTPVMPISMLSPGKLDDRFVRNLPLEWDVTTTFEVAADGRTAQVRSTATDPPTFARHMNAAVSSWRFQPATLEGAAVPVRCEASMQFKIDYP